MKLLRLFTKLGIRKSISKSKIGLFAIGELEFSEENAVKIVDSKNGKFDFGNVDYGEYIIAEIPR